MNTPNPIPGSKATLSDKLTVQFLTNRTLALEVDTSVLVVLTTKEVDALYRYLHSNKRLFFTAEEGGPC
jgi:hypothetical protein